MQKCRSFLLSWSPFALLLGLAGCGAESPGGTGMPDPNDGLPNMPTDMAPGDTAEPGDTESDPPPNTNGEAMNPTDIPIAPTPEDMPPTDTPPSGELTTPAPPLVPEALDCGPDGWAVENHGPPANRVNYVILGDGYDATTINTTLVEHVNYALDRHFNHESGEPYGRYRNFVNICVMKVVSQNNGIGNGPTPFGGGNGGDRLADVDNGLVTAYLNANTPEGMVWDWRAVVLNQGLWENTGSALMLWSGANDEAPGAALHEGGHGFHGLADEYCASGTGANCGPEGGTATSGERQEVNSTGNPTTTGGKWDHWLGHTQVGLKVPNQGGTGIQSVFEGSRYTDDGQYRPTSNSMMNSLFGRRQNGQLVYNVNTSFNDVSREQIVFSIWRAVRPVDSTNPPAGAVNAPATLTVNVVDPAVISIDWSIDGVVRAEKAGGVLNIAAANLPAGTHTITARAYDNATEDLVRNREGRCPTQVAQAGPQYCHAPAWQNSIQTVEWTVTIP